MAEDIGGICREYVSANAHSVVGLNDDQAVSKLVIGAKQRLIKLGWSDDADAYGIDIEGLVREQLYQHRD